MSRFYSLALVLLLSLLSSTVAETIVTDSVGNGVRLPSTGGNATNQLGMTNPLVSTSPYYLWISLNNGNPNSPNQGQAGEIESFYVNTPGAGLLNATEMQFGSGSLLSEWYSSDFSSSGGVQGSYCRNASHPNTATGMYTLVFNIPAGQSLLLNLTYVQSGNSPRPITELISVNIFNPFSITGDPQFVGLRGQSYQVHGIDGAVYNIISEQSTQVNSRFVFLTEGQCPIIDGKKDVNCWSHAGSYLGEMSFQAIVDGKLHAALVQSGSAKRGFAGVQMDGVALQVGDKVEMGEFTLEFTSTHSVQVTTDSFEFDLYNSDMFINQALRARVPLSQLQSHGLLGQTHSTATYPTSLKYVEGDVDDYVIADSNIFGTSFLYNRFNV